MICALSISPWWRSSSGESLLSLCGPLSGKSCYSQTWHFSCVALEETLNTDRAFDPQMLLAQSSKLRESLAGSLSHTPHIQWVRKFSRLLCQSMSRIQPLLTTSMTTTLAKTWTSISWAGLPSNWPLCFQPGCLTCLFSTRQHSASQIISVLCSTPYNNGLKPTNMLKNQEFLMINKYNNKERLYCWPLANASNQPAFKKIQQWKEGENPLMKGWSEGLWSSYCVSEESVIFENQHYFRNNAAEGKV